MDARSIIAKLRQKTTPTKAELGWFAQGLADLSVSDAQAGAFAMAVCLNGLDDSGRAALTLAMRDSGQVLRWSLDGPVLDKHSTGGVGDCVSLILAPALAACGAYVPMISGRGLGHTGGTLDKLESIPGVTTTLDETRFRSVVSDAGCAIVSASAHIAPADKRLYAVRDVTATVESLDLITASILSKKLAAGLDGLVLDVKTGSGAFMKSLTEARALAQALTRTANASGCPTTAIVSDMSQPLAASLGNALEIVEVMKVLTGRNSGRLVDICAALGGTLLASAGLAEDQNKGGAAITAAIGDGRAAERFGKMVAAMGGPVQFVESWARFLPEAPVISEVIAARDGYINAIDGEALGLAVVAMGGGRQVESDTIDPAVGISDVLALGTKVSKGQPIARLHAAREETARKTAQTIQAAIGISAKKPKLPDLIHARIT
jgi:thymidine phosphorylase